MSPVCTHWERVEMRASKAVRLRFTYGTRTVAGLEGGQDTPSGQVGAA